MELEELLSQITPADKPAMERCLKNWDAIAKPLNGLGHLEEMLVRVAGATGKTDLALGAKAGRGAVRTMLRQMGLEGPLHSIGSLMDTIRQRAHNTGRPLTQGEVQALAKHQECLDGGVC